MRILIYGAGVIGEKSMKNEEYKKLSINEFTQYKDVKMDLMQKLKI